MKRSLLALTVGLIAGAGGLYLLNQRQAQIHYLYDVNLLAGTYQADDGRRAATATITEVTKPGSKGPQREFKGYFSTMTPSGCVGEYTGFGKPDNEGITFEDANKSDCTMITTLTDGGRYLRIKAYGTQCSDYAGMHCGFGGKLERETELKNL